MLEVIIILGLIAYIGWLRYSHRRQVDRILVHAAGLEAELQAVKWKEV